MPATRFYPACSNRYLLLIVRRLPETETQFLKQVLEDWGLERQMADYG